MGAGSGKQITVFFAAGYGPAEGFARKMAKWTVPDYVGRAVISMDNTRRFTDRADYYVKYRPSYPKEAIDFMYGALGFSGRSVIADVGSGTGILTKLLLERGSTVYAVEPNRQMRELAERALGDEPNFYSIDGTAERTGLPDQAVDFIVCAQSFHWFDRDSARREFRRILRSGGIVVLMWNEPRKETDEFTGQYEKLGREFGKDYERISHRNWSIDQLRPFFQDGVCHEAEFDNEQNLDFEGFRGRLLSSSYMPLPGDDKYEALMEKARNLFDAFNRDGVVTIRYRTELFYGTV